MMNGMTNNPMMMCMMASPQIVLVITVTVVIHTMLQAKSLLELHKLSNRQATAGEHQ